MTEMPKVLPETPSTDLLSDLLSGMHLSGTVLFRAEFREPWSVLTPDSRQLANVLPFHTEHIIPFHLIAAGGCWLEVPECKPVWLEEGEAVLLPYGHRHLLKGREPAAALPVGRLLPRPPWNDVPVVEHGGSGTTARIICGFLQCDELLFHPILRHLPVLLQVSRHAASADGWLAGTIRHTAAEASHLVPGSCGMLPRLTELMFVEVLRNHIRGLSPEEVGWFAALNDRVAGAALKYLHAAPLHEWTVEDLARQVGVSRTRLVERFKHFFGLPPMRYLAAWRLQSAAQLLKSGTLPVKAIAGRSGYDSEAAFSRAFKRRFGLSPGDWRKRPMRT